jgi:hypothetical protein
MNGYSVEHIGHSIIYIKYLFLYSSFMNNILFLKPGQPANSGTELTFWYHSFRNLAFSIHMESETDVPSACFWLNH